MAHHTLDQVRVVVDAELVRNRKKQRIGRFDCLVLCEFLYEPVWLPAYVLPNRARPPSR